jgi:ABC-type nitrate/sulfonate/bicarbonate transport system substrate-binding protein
MRAWENTNLSRVLGSLSLILLLLPISTRSAHAQDRDKIRVALSTVSFTFLVNLIAKEAGIFKKHGLEVESILVSGPAQTAALAAGEIDYNSSFVPGLLLAAKGLPATVVMATTKTPFFYIISQPGIETIATLPGKKVAVSRIGSQSHNLTRSMIRQSGVNPDAVTYIQTGSASNSFTALNAKSVDAATLSIPFNVLMRQKGFNQLSSTQSIGIYPNTGLQVPKAKIEKNRVQVKSMIRAFLDSLKYIANEKGKVSDYIQRTWKLSPDVAEQTYKDFLPSLPMDGKISLEAVQEYLDQAYKNNEIPQRVDVNTIVDYSILDEVLREK